jgi:hypothetical protein
MPPPGQRAFRSFQAFPAFQALALGRAETCSCQRRTWPSSCGIASFDTFMKSTATWAVMSATVKFSPARQGLPAS